MPKFTLSEVTSVSEHRGVTVRIVKGVVGSTCCGIDYAPADTTCSQCRKPLQCFGIYILKIGDDVKKILPTPVLDDVDAEKRGELVSGFANQLVNLKLDRPLDYQKMKPYMPPIDQLRPVEYTKNEFGKRRQGGSQSATSAMEEDMERSGWFGIVAEINERVLAKR